MEAVADVCRHDVQHQRSTLFFCVSPVSFLSRCALSPSLSIEEDEGHGEVLIR